MEDQSNTTVPVQTAAQRKAHDFEPVQSTNTPQADTQAAVPRPPGTYDPNDPPGKG